MTAPGRLFLAVLIVGLLAWLINESRAHEAPLGWLYPANCCSGRDCAEAPSGSVREGPNGYEVTLLPGQHPMVKDEPHSFVVAYDARQIRDSPDGRFHVCLSPQLRLLCFFAGSRGF